MLYKNSRYRIAAAALLGGMALAACDSIKDVREEPNTELPQHQVVLAGKVYGLGIRRSVVLQNGTGADATTELVQAGLGEPIGARGRETRFSFGTLAEGTAYNITVRADLVPYGKTCAISNGSGTITYNPSDPLQGAPQNIEVVCQNDPAIARHDIRVDTPEPFRSAAGAKVTLLTEEGEFTADPKDAADGDPDYVWFRDAVVTLPASGVLPFQNIITATTETGSTATLRLVNRCAVANHTFPSPVGVGADVTNVSVGACAFTVGGTDASGGAVKYSLPVGVATASPMGPGGLTLELKYPNGDPVPSAGSPTTEVNVAAFGSNFTFATPVTSGSECPVTPPGEAPIPCEVRGFYEVVVKSQPAGQVCLVASSTVGLLGPLFPGNPTTPAVATYSGNTNWGNAANLYLLNESVATGSFPTSPSNYTGLRVYCRDVPVADRQLRGTYQVTNMTTYAAGAVSASLPWSPAYTARREYSHILTLFDDGTFLFGAHTASDAVNSVNVSNHAEHGFYDWDPTNLGGGAVAGAKLRFTVHADTNTGAVTAPLAAGISAAEGPVYTGGTLAAGTTCAFSAATSPVTIKHQVLTNVVLGGGAQRTITGRFGPDGAPTPRCAVTAARDIEFREPLSVPAQLTGSWIARDHLRFWTFNFDTSVVYHVGANGYPNVQDTCLKVEDYTVPSGTYVPSTGGGAVYCNPVGSAFQSNLSSLAHSPPPLLQARLPGWQGYLPGTELGGGSSARSPSPVYFHIAPAASFAAGANATVFPPVTIGTTTWCPSEIIGIRGTLNGELSATLKPLYFCRNSY